jgi:hypothetical protein
MEACALFVSGCAIPPLMTVTVNIVSRSYVDRISREGQANKNSMEFIS